MQRPAQTCDTKLLRNVPCFIWHPHARRCARTGGAQGTYLVLQMQRFSDATTCITTRSLTCDWLTPKRIACHDRDSLLTLVKSVQPQERHRPTMSNTHNTKRITTKSLTCNRLTPKGVACHNVDSDLLLVKSANPQECHRPTVTDTDQVDSWNQKHLPLIIRS